MHCPAVGENMWEQIYVSVKGFAVGDVRISLKILEKGNRARVVERGLNPRDQKQPEQIVRRGR